MSAAYRAATVVGMDRAECRDRRQVRKLTQDWAIVAFDFGRWVASMAATIRADNRQAKAATADQRIRQDWAAPGDKL